MNKTIITIVSIIVVIMVIIGVFAIAYFFQTTSVPKPPKDSSPKPSQNQVIKTLELVTLTKTPEAPLSMEKPITLEFQMTGSIIMPDSKSAFILNTITNQEQLYQEGNSLDSKNCGCWIIFRITQDEVILHQYHQDGSVARSYILELSYNAVPQKPPAEKEQNNLKKPLAVEKTDSSKLAALPAVSLTALDKIITSFPITQYELSQKLHGRKMSDLLLTDEIIKNHQPAELIGIISKSTAKIEDETAGQKETPKSAGVDITREIKNILFSEQINYDNAPISASVTFPSDAKQIYACFKNDTYSNRITYKWYNLTSMKVMYWGSVDFPPFGDTYILLKPQDCWQLGRYRVYIYKDIQDAYPFAGGDFDIEEASLSQSKIEVAIKKGTDFLISQIKLTGMRYRTLVFYTLIKSGVKIPESLNKTFLDNMLRSSLSNTYDVALSSMVLTELDKTKYLERIIQCTEFLLANQSINGNWSYGTPLPYFINSNLLTIKPVEETSSKIMINIPVRRNDNRYDNSNSHFALLGLRACAEANIEIPQEVWRDAEKHLIQSQNSDGGWGYTKSKSYGSMTAAGLSGSVISKYYQDKKIDGDQNIKKSIDWLTANFTVKENPQSVNPAHHYYFLYALEQASVLSGVESFGENEWYPLGARYLLNAQGENGSWKGTTQGFASDETLNTCFAVLFLRRAIKPLKVIIASTPQ